MASLEPNLAKSRTVPHGTPTVQRSRTLHRAWTRDYHGDANGGCPRQLGERALGAHQRDAGGSGKRHENARKTSREGCRRGSHSRSSWRNAQREGHGRDAPRGAPASRAVEHRRTDDAAGRCERDKDIAGRLQTRQSLETRERGTRARACRVGGSEQTCSVASGDAGLRATP